MEQYIIISLKYPGVFKYKNLNTKKYFTKVPLHPDLNRMKFSMNFAGSMFKNFREMFVINLFSIVLKSNTHS